MICSSPGKPRHARIGAARALWICEPVRFARCGRRLAARAGFARVRFPTPCVKRAACPAEGAPLLTNADVSQNSRCADAWLAPRMFTAVDECSRLLTQLGGRARGGASSGRRPADGAALDTARMSTLSALGWLGEILCTPPIAVIPSTAHTISASCSPASRHNSLRSIHVGYTSSRTAPSTAIAERARLQRDCHLSRTAEPHGSRSSRDRSPDRQNLDARARIFIKAYADQKAALGGA